jgi:hypothetical protein
LTTSTLQRLTLEVHPVTRRDVYALLLVLVVASAMRLGDLGRITHFQFDQGEHVIPVMDMLSGKGVPLLGQTSSTGLPHSPLTLYVLAPAYALWDNPQFVAVYISVLNVMGVGLLWLIAHRYFSPNVGLVTGLTYALSPWAVSFSSLIWVPNFVAPFILLGILLGLYGFVERKGWAQALSLPVFIVGVQMHPAAWLLLPVYLWIIWMGRRNIAPLAILTGVVLAALLLMPYVVGLRSLPSNESGGAISQILEHLNDLHLRDKALIYLTRMATGLGGPWVGTPGIGEYTIWLEFPTPITYSWLLVGVATVGGLVALWWRWRWRRWSLAMLVTLWAVVPYLLLVPNWIGVFPHYFVGSIPALCLLAAIGIEWLLSQLRESRQARAAVFGVFGAALLTQGIQYESFMRYADANYTELLPFPPIHYMLDVRSHLTPYHDVIISGGTSHKSGYSVWKAMLYNSAACVRELVIASGGIAVFPAEPFAVLTPPGALEAAAGDLYSTSSPVIVPMRTGEGVYRIDTFGTAPEWDGPTLAEIAPARFDNGATLAGYRLDSNRVYLEWRLGSAGSHDSQYFAHFLDTNGEKVGQQDASFWPTHYWCPGDRVITWIDATIPENTATLRVGMYALEGDHFMNSSVLDDAGNPAAGWVDIPLRVPN